MATNITQYQSMMKLACNSLLHVRVHVQAHEAQYLYVHPLWFQSCKHDDIIRQGELSVMASAVL